MGVGGGWVACPTLTTEPSIMVYKAPARSPLPFIFQTSAEPTSYSTSACATLPPEELASPPYVPHSLTHTHCLRLGSPKETLRRGFVGQSFIRQSFQGKPVGEGEADPEGEETAKSCLTEGNWLHPSRNSRNSTRHAGPGVCTPPAGIGQGLPRGCKSPSTSHLPRACRLGGSGSLGIRNARSPRGGAA